MGRLNSGLDTFNAVVGIAKYAPAIGSAITALKSTITAIRPTFNSAYARVKTIDAKIYPWKNDVNNGKIACNQGKYYMCT